MVDSLPLLELKASLQGKPLESLDSWYEDFKQTPIGHCSARWDSPNETQWHRDISVQEKWVIARISELPQIIRLLPFNQQSSPLKTNAKWQKVRIERYQRQRWAGLFKKKFCFFREPSWIESLSIGLGDWLHGDSLPIACSCFLLQSSPAPWQWGIEFTSAS